MGFIPKYVRELVVGQDFVSEKEKREKRGGGREKYMDVCRENSEGVKDCCWPAVLRGRQRLQTTSS
jgi:hypothetical protein